MLLFINREWMSLPFGLPGRIRGAAHVRRKEPASGYAESFPFEQHRETRMVGQVSSNREVADDFDAERTQPFRGPNAGALQNTWTVVDAGADDDFIRAHRLQLARAVDIGDARRRAFPGERLDR